MHDEVGSITAHDPIALGNAIMEIDNHYDINFSKEWKNKIEDLDIIIICTNWSEYSVLASMNDLLKGKVIFDTRSFLSEIDASDFQYMTVN